MDKSSLVSLCIKTFLKDDKNNFNGMFFPCNLNVSCYNNFIRENELKIIVKFAKMIPKHIFDRYNIIKLISYKYKYSFSSIDHLIEISKKKLYDYFFYIVEPFHENEYYYVDELTQNLFKIKKTIKKESIYSVSTRAELKKIFNCVPQEIFDEKIKKLLIYEFDGLINILSSDLIDINYVKLIISNLSIEAPLNVLIRLLQFIPCQILDDEILKLIIDKWNGNNNEQGDWDKFGDIKYTCFTKCVPENLFNNEILKLIIDKWTGEDILKFSDSIPKKLFNKEILQLIINKSTFYNIKKLTEICMPNTEEIDFVVDIYYDCE